MTALNVNPTLTAAPITMKRSMLSRLWPFSSRRIVHRTFGKLKPWRNGNYLRGRAEFGPENDDIWLVIRADAAGPTNMQEKLYLQIEKHYPTLLPKMLKALLVEYHKVRQIQKQIKWPLVVKSEELLKIIPLDALWIEQGPGHPFVFSFQSELDKDHEFHVFFRNGKLESVAFEH